MFYYAYFFPNNAVMEEDEEEVNQEDIWVVITSYFDAKGLVRQQLDSFDVFIEITMQEIVDESPDIVIIPEPQHLSGQNVPTQMVI